MDKIKKIIPYLAIVLSIANIVLLSVVLMKLKHIENSVGDTDNTDVINAIDSAKDDLESSIDDAKSDIESSIDDAASDIKRSVVIWSD